VVFVALGMALALLAIIIWVPKLSFVQPAGPLTPAARASAESELRGQLIQAIGGLVLIVGAYFTARTFALNREGQITERFTRAVEQVANDKLDIRLGGIYALERIARDSRSHYEPVMEVLSAFLRENTRSRASEGEAAGGIASGWRGDAPGNGDERSEAAKGQAEAPALRVDFQAAASVLERRDRRHERPEYQLNLRGADLRRALLMDAHLESTRFDHADLQEAIFFRAHLNLASFQRAHMKAARFDDADLRGATLDSANMDGAIFFGADMAGVMALAACFERADLRGAHLEAAILWQAHLEGAKLTGAHLEAADLTETTGLTQQQLEGAITDAATKLPEHLAAKPAHGQENR
jgi:uncharacterized protein YjbI with pentapeptide repeats